MTPSRCTKFGPNRLKTEKLFPATLEKALCGELTPSRVPPAPVSSPLCCLLPPRAPVLTQAENLLSPQTWLYRDMRLPQLGSVVLWLRVFTQLWNLQDMFETIWRFDLNSIWECGGRHALGTYQDIPLGVPDLSGLWCVFFFNFYVWIFQQFSNSQDML